MISRLLHISVLVACLGLAAGCSKEPTVTTRSQQALQAYTEGVRHWEDFYYNEAKSAFERALSYDSTFAMAWGRLAMLNASTQNDSAARTAIERSVAYAGNVSQREQLYIRMWENWISHRISKAREVADSLVDAYPEEIEAYATRGMMNESAKNLDAAIADYQRAVDIDTSYARGYMLLGYAFSTANEQDKALASMQHYVRLAPEAADPRASFADLLLRVGRYEEALEQYRQSLKIKPDYWYAIDQIGEVYSILGRLKDAEAQFDRGMALLPQSKQLQATHLAVEGWLNLHRAHYMPAIDQFLEALAEDSTNGTAANGLAFAFAKLGDFTSAFEVLRRIRLELERRELTDSRFMQNFYTLKARVLTEQRKFPEALADCDSALESTTPLSRAMVYRQVAEIRLSLGEYEPALDACEEALRPNRNSPEALYVLAKIYHAKGDRRMTEEIGRRLLQFWRDADPDFHRKLEIEKLLGESRPS